MPVNKVVMEACWGKAVFGSPENQKADPFSRIRPQSVDDLHCFCFCRDFSWFLYPTAYPHFRGISAVQTESFEYIERPVTRCGLWEYLQCRLEDDSSLHLQLARVVGPLKSIVPKTLSSLTFCFCFCYRTSSTAFCSCCWRCFVTLVFVGVRQIGCSPCANFWISFINRVLRICRP